MRHKKYHVTIERKYPRVGGTVSVIPIHMRMGKKTTSPMTVTNTVHVPPRKVVPTAAETLEKHRQATMDHLKKKYGSSHVGVGEMSFQKAIHKIASKASIKQKNAIATRMAKMIRGKHH